MIKPDIILVYPVIILITVQTVLICEICGFRRIFDGRLAGNRRGGGGRAAVSAAGGRRADSRAGNRRGGRSAAAGGAARGAARPAGRDVRPAQLAALARL